MKITPPKTLWIITDVQYSGSIFASISPMIHDQSYRIGTFVDSTLAFGSSVIEDLGYIQKDMACNALIILVVNARSLSSMRDIICSYKEIRNNETWLFGLTEDTQSTVNFRIFHSAELWTGFECSLSKQYLSSAIYRAALVHGKMDGIIVPDTKMIINAALSGYLLVTHRLSLARGCIEKQIDSLFNRNVILKQHLVNSRWAFIRIAADETSIGDIDILSKVLCGYFSQVTEVSIFSSNDHTCSSMALSVDLILFQTPDEYKSIVG